MTAEQIASQLQPLIGEIHSQHFCYRLVDSWVAADVEPDQVIEPVLRFMEEHTDIDFGLPGPLVTFMERSLKEDEAGRSRYEKLLLESLQRKPVPYTIWMVNRILNIAVEPERRDRWLEALMEARQSSQADPELQENIDSLLAYQAAKGL